MMSGDLKGAAAAFDSAVNLDGSLVEPRFNRAVVALRAGDTKRAGDDFAKLESANDLRASLRPQVAYHRALALDRSGDAHGAEAALERALAVDPQFAPAMLYTGLLREKRRDLQGAVRSYLDYLKIHPESTAAMLRVGIVAQRAGRTDVGVTYLRKVVEKAPTSPEGIEARKYLVMWE